MDASMIDKPFQWIFVLKWTVATGLGWLFAHPFLHLFALEMLPLWGTLLVICIAVGSIVQALMRRKQGLQPHWWSIGTNTGCAVAAMIALAFTHPGSIAGVLQWPVLRPHIMGSAWWILASCVGAGIEATMRGVMVGGSVYLSYALSGAVFGLMQWLVLRSHLTSAGWWVVVSPIGWVVGRLGTVAVGAVYNLLSSNLSEQAALIVAHTAPNLIGGALCGVVTGTSLAVFLRTFRQAVDG